MRYPDWRARLARYVTLQAQARFRPGRHDCALFAVDAVREMTGVDIGEGLRGYRSLAEGWQGLAAAGFGSLGELFAARLREVEPHLAQVGDVVILEENGEEACGVVQGPFIYVLRLDGLGLVPVSRARRAFRA